MATGRERRAEKLNQRLRGAQRANVGDDSFNLDISGLAINSPSEPTPVRRTPNTSAKRRRLDNEAPTTITQAEGSVLRRSPRLSPQPEAKNPYDLPDTSKESVAQVVSVISAQRRIPRTSPRESVTRVSKSKSPAAVPIVNDEPDAPQSLPKPRTFRSPAARRVSSVPLEEITESPANKPGSGTRRLISSGGLPPSSRLRSAVSMEAEVPQSSSPLARKVRRSDATASTRSARSSRGQSLRLAEMTEVDELSPERPTDGRPVDEEGVLSETYPAEELEEQDAESTDEEPVPEIVEPEEPEPEEAEEIEAVEAAKVLGKKRPRMSLRTGSPELGNTEAEQEEPLPKRRRGRPTRSPAVQRQSGPKPKAKQDRPEPQPKPKTKAAPKKTSKLRRESVEDDGPSIEITVQRFVNVKKHVMDEANEDDPLQSEMPFANRGETVIDVLAQICKEVIEATLGQFEKLSQETEDRAKKKEIRIKARAIEAYGEELNSRFLQHAIHLNDWQTLRKRVRHVQKEKLALRDEILRLKAEREQVALRMDAVRVQHEEDNQESTYRLDTSALMHNIDLAVDQGRNAPELSRAEQKYAELANLELLVSQVTEEASSASSTGGLLEQVRSFNAFLERTALALESR